MVRTHGKGALQGGYESNLGIPRSPESRLNFLYGNISFMLLSVTLDMANARGAAQADKEKQPYRNSDV